eukprot:TRINITY_DN5021_c0_g1_i1.p1 TRINITY_DN5021_c0_g1~~TRINITY_DN5021_c0_g1_i1.p1  ORF type:complete len:220 (-),score=55.61 TRINITY_DN5021_c0_g1_i1:69-728(-)
MDLPENKLTPEQVKKIRAAFDKADTDHSGTLSKQELRSVLEETLARKISDQLFESYLKLQFRATDKDFNKVIDFNEFCSLYSKIYINPELPISMKPKEGSPSVRLESGVGSPKIKKDDLTLTPEEEAEARAEFRKYDADGSGTIDKQELRALVVASLSKKMGEGMINRLVDSHMQLADKDGSGSVSVEEFLVLWAKLHKAGSPSVGSPVIMGMPMPMKR